MSSVICFIIITDWYNQKPPYNLTTIIKVKVTKPSFQGQKVKNILVSYFVMCLLHNVAHYLPYKYISALDVRHNVSLVHPPRQKRARWVPDQCSFCWVLHSNALWYESNIFVSRICFPIANQADLGLNWWQNKLNKPLCHAEVPLLRLCNPG